MKRISQMNFVADLCKLVAKHGAKALRPYQINAIIRAADSIIHEIERPFVPAVPWMGLAAWLSSDDTGASSRFMAYVLSDGPECDQAHPLDADDFGRCYRFLRAVPEKDRTLLDNMGKCSKEWEALIAEWAVLERLYEAEASQNLSITIRRILSGVGK